MAITSSLARCDFSHSLGHFLSLPHRTSNGRFTSISGHKTAHSVWRDGTGAQERVSNATQAEPRRAQRYHARPSRRRNLVTRTANGGEEGKGC